MDTKNKHTVVISHIVTKYLSSWVHKKCSGIRGSLRADPSYKCRVCTGSYVLQERPGPLVLDGVALETVDTFCYLGDTISAAGGARESVVTRIRCGWGWFRKLLLVLTTKIVFTAQER